MLGIVLILIAAVCAFTFPSFLIEAIKSNDEETANTAKKLSCITFGILMLDITFFIFASSW